MSIIRIALGVFLGLILTAVLFIGGTAYVANLAKNSAETYSRCAAFEGYTENLIRADLFNRDKPSPPTRLSDEERTLVENTAASVLAKHKQDVANGRRELPSADLIAQANEILCPG